MKIAFASRLCIAVLTSVIFSGAAGILLMNAYQGFYQLFFILLTYLTPAVLFIGLPASILLDAVLHRWKIQNFALRLIAGGGLYAGAGFVGTWLYIFIITGGILSGKGWLSLADRDFYTGILPFSWIGVTSALLFFALHTLLLAIIGRMKA
jgi:hypothetical protein